MSSYARLWGRFFFLPVFKLRLENLRRGMGCFFFQIKMTSRWCFWNKETNVKSWYHSLKITLKYIHDLPKTEITIWSGWINQCIKYNISKKCAKIAGFSQSSTKIGCFLKVCAFHTWNHLEPGLREGVRTTRGEGYIQPPRWWSLDFSASMVTKRFSEVFVQKLKDTALYLDNEGKIMRQKHQDFSLVTNF